ncbi:MAG: XRE family transcriptional regulator [Moraxella sp.]|nr:XRE family transcriptional regulator [Moraxella sp.]
MNNYHFTIAIRDADDAHMDELENALYAANCDDALLCVENGQVYLEFDRMAVNAKTAICSALADINRAGFHDLIVQESGVATLSQMASRAGLTRQALSLYAKHKRGSNFPKPIYGVATPTLLYSWREVASWLYQQGKLSHNIYEVAIEQF